MSCNIYIYTHKDFEPVVSDPRYKILTEVELPEKKLETVNVNTGDNIQRFGSCYSELKGLYWVWKNINVLPNFIGFNHYRRYFDFLNDIPELKPGEILLPRPMSFESIECQYGYCHNINDIRLCFDIVKELYPDYSESVDNTLKSKLLYNGNCFIMSKEYYLKYMEWLFSVLFEFDKRMCFGTYDDVKRYVDNTAGYRRNGQLIDYQYRIEAFLSERLFTLYINHNYQPSDIRYVDYMMSDCTDNYKEN